jgi:hypothetical protein
LAKHVAIVGFRSFEQPDHRSSQKPDLSGRTRSPHCGNADQEKITRLDGRAHRPGKEFRHKALRFLRWKQEQPKPKFVEYPRSR